MAQGTAMNILRTALAKVIRFALPDFGVDPQAPRARSDDYSRDLGYQFPVTRNIFAGNMADWEDPVYDLDPEGHSIVRRCAPIFSAIQKRGEAIAKLEWEVRGGNEARRRDFKLMWERSIGWTDYFQWMEWARTEGVRFAQIKLPEDTPTDSVTGCNWLGGGRRHWKAGPRDGRGTLAWDGTNLMRVRETMHGAPVFFREEEGNEQVLPRDEFVVFRPGAGSNPQGDHDMGLILYDMAVQWRKAIEKGGKYVDIYAILMGNKRVQGMMPTDVGASMDALTNAMVNMPKGSPLTLAEGDIIRAFKPEGTPLQDLWHHINELAGVVWILLLGQKLTQDTADAGPTGSSKVALSEKQIAILCAAQQHAEALNTQWAPQMAAINEDVIAPLADGETECYFWPQYPTHSDEGDIATSQEASEEQEPESLLPEPEEERALRIAGQIESTLINVRTGDLTPKAAKHVLRRGLRLTEDAASEIDALVDAHSNGHHE